MIKAEKLTQSDGRSNADAMREGATRPSQLPTRSTVQFKKSENHFHAKTLAELVSEDDDSMVYIGNQSGLMDADKIHALPGQPAGVEFNQYAGYVTVDAMAGRALFYYFVESPNNSDTKPLVLWLHGGCSSFGDGAMGELGPFRVNRDGKTLFRNQYAWNKEANVIFLESPAGIGFSYSNTSSDYKMAGDKRTTKDSYTFLINWLERFPLYKSRDFYITGNDYAGHYAPQLADTILSKNNITNQTPINLKGIAIGNAWIDHNTAVQGIYDYYWTHGLNSDETHDGITKYCDYDNGNFTRTCLNYQDQGNAEVGCIDLTNIYAPLCDLSAPKHPPPGGSAEEYDPCSINYVKLYLNLPEVQKALHTINKEWSCSHVGWTDSPQTMLPTINKLIDKGIRLWLYSGDMDGWIPITSSRYAINKLKLPVETSWRAWYSKKEVGGYVIAYKGLVLTTVRGAGLGVPRDQPERALTMFSSFLEGKLLPSS